MATLFEEPLSPRFQRIAGPEVGPFLMMPKRDRGQKLHVIREINQLHE